MIEPGTKNGEIRRGPPLSRALWLCSIIGRPPIPEPMATPMREAFSSEHSMPASWIAWAPAAIPYWMKRSILRASLGFR